MDAAVLYVEHTRAHATHILVNLVASTDWKIDAGFFLLGLYQDNIHTLLSQTRDLCSAFSLVVGNLVITIERFDWLARFSTYQHVYRALPHR